MAAQQKLVHIVPKQKPKAFVLHCPECKKTHIDQDEWATRPHRTHRCEHCQHEWTPFEYATVGVHPDQCLEPYGMTVPLSRIHYDQENNIREETDSDLSGSLQQVGQLQSVLLMPRKEKGPNGEQEYDLIAGARRYKGAVAAKMDHLICIVKNFASKEDAHIAMMRENSDRKNLSLYEVLRWIKKYVEEKKFTAMDLEAKCGLSREHAKAYFDLAANLSPMIFEILRHDESSGTIVNMHFCATHVGRRALSREQKFKEQDEWWKSKGWKRSYRGNDDPPRVAKIKTATHDQIADMADRVLAARVLRRPDGSVISLNEDQSKAVYEALLWCSDPKSHKSPL